MIKKIHTYLLFLLRSTNQHGVHSPFVYDFITKCLYAHYKEDRFSLFRTHKKQLLATKTQIKVEDFGAGSKVFSSHIRSVSAIVKVAGISNKRAKLLAKTVSYFNSKEILEIGTSLGLATTALVVGNENGHITTLEGCKQTAKVALEQFKKLKLNTIELVVGNFENSLEEVLKNKTYDLIFFDGNHTKKATLQYFNSCLQTIHNDSVFIFDDIYWSEEMTECWEEIKQHPLVTVTIDTYKWGFVFFRKEQAKEHFTVRV